MLTSMYIYLYIYMYIFIHTYLYQQRLNSCKDSYFDLEQGRWTSWEDLMEAPQFAPRPPPGELSEALKGASLHVYTYIYT